MHHLGTFCLLGLVVLALPRCDCSGSSVLDDDGGTRNDDGGSEDGGGGAPSPLLDTEFGQDGAAWAPSSWSTDSIYTACRAADGKITVGGATIDLGHSSQLLVGRFTADGQPDTTFGSGGQKKIPLYDMSRVTDMAATADGAVIITGTAYSSEGNAFAARIDSDGELDATFGAGGFVVWEADYHGGAAVAVDDQGRVLVLSSLSTQAVVRRLGSDGSLDTGFGSQGLMGLGGETPRALVVLADGKILALTANRDDSRLHRLNPDGSFDDGFAGGGFMNTDFLANDVAVDPNGSDLLLAGLGDTGNVLLKLTADGAPVSGFGTDGLLSVAADDEVTVVAWLPSGEILLVHSIANHPGNHYRGIVRLDADGAPLAFDESSTALFQFEITKRLLVDADALYLVGSQKLSIDTPAQRDSRMSVLGFAADGTPKADYGNAGLAQITSNGAPEVLWDMLRRSDGSVILAASAGIYGVLLRFVDGELDTTFGGDGFADEYPSQLSKIREDGAGGIVALNFSGTISRFAADGSWDRDFTPDILPAPSTIRDLAVDDDGRIVVTGGILGGLGTPILARYNSDGSLDSSFGDAGIVQGFEGINGFALSVHLDAEGMILASGEWYPPGAAAATFIARFHEDGSPDSSFGASGVAEVDGSNYFSRIISRGAGGYLFTTQSAFATTIQVYAMDDSGEQISDFGTGGMAFVEVKGGGVHDLLELDDGRILIAQSETGEQFERMLVWCLRPDGQTDSSFGDDGRFVHPGQGRAVKLLQDADGVLVGGHHFNEQTGTDVVMLRIEP